MLHRKLLKTNTDMVQFKHKYIININRKRKCLLINTFDQNYKIKVP